MKIIIIIVSIVLPLIISSIKLPIFSKSKGDLEGIKDIKLPLFSKSKGDLEGIKDNKGLRGNMRIISSIITLYIILGYILVYNENNNEYQERLDFFGFSFGLDGIGLSLIALMAIIEPILLLLIYPSLPQSETGSKTGSKSETGSKTGTETGTETGLEGKGEGLIGGVKILIIIIFSTLDLLIFFITFELILIPIFLLITKQGSKYKYFIPRLEAAIRFFIYTMIGSILMLGSILILYLKYGTTSNELLNLKIANPHFEWAEEELRIMKIVWIFFFFSFLIKIPMYPFHTWLPLAHSEAPTIGSIILAALLLKLASFGILRYSLYIFNGNNNFDDIVADFLPIIYILAIISIIYSALIPLRGLYDFKKIIAYSSIVHMNFSIFGFFSKDFLGLFGASLLMFTHAFISSALFLLIGLLYKRYHSRFLPYFQGLSNTMPLFSFFFLFFSFANISLPFCSSFLSEFFILLSSFHSNPFLSSLLLTSLLISTAFVLWFANRLLFGSFSPYLLSIPLAGRSGGKPLPGRSGGKVGYKDLSLTEFIALIPFFFFSFFLTFFPQSLISILSLPLLLTF